MGYYILGQLVAEGHSFHEPAAHSLWRLSVPGIDRSFPSGPGLWQVGWAMAVARGKALLHLAGRLRRVVDADDTRPAGLREDPP
jgi:hypothetical protein